MGIELWKLRFGLFREIPFSVQLELQLRPSSMGLDPKNASWICRMEQGGPKPLLGPILIYLGYLVRSILHCPLTFPCTPSPRQGILSGIKSLQYPTLGNVWDLTMGISSQDQGRAAPAALSFCKVFSITA